MNFASRICFFLCLLFVTTRQANAQTDSLRRELKKPAGDTTRIHLLIALGEALFFANPDTSLPLCEEALGIIEKDYDKASEKEKNTLLYYKAWALNNIGYVYERHGAPLKALSYYKQALKIEERINDREGVAICLNNIAVLYYDFGDLPQALDLHMKSLKIKEERKDTLGMAYSLNNLASIYEDQRQIAKAQEYYERSLALKKAIKDYRGIGNTYANLGGLYMDKGDFTKALDHYTLSLQAREKIGDSLGIANSYQNIASLYSRQKNNDKALEFYKKSLAIREGGGDQEGLAYSLANIANTLLHLNRAKEARPYAERSLKIAQSLGFVEVILTASQILASVNAETGNWKEAYQLHKLYKKMSDSLENQANQRAALNSQLRYEYEKKAAADSVRTGEEIKVYTAQMHVEKTQRIALYGGLILVAAFSLFLFNRYRVIGKQKFIIEQQKEEVDSAFDKLHQKNKEVMDSISYARRIQSSLLTSERVIQRELDRLKGKS